MYSIIDSGATSLNISVLYFESIIQNMFDYAGVTDWEYLDGSVYTYCSNMRKMPSLYFQFDKKWIEARPQDYMFDYSGFGDC